MNSNRWRNILSDDVAETVSQYALLRELLEYMTPLFIVSNGSASASSLQYVAIPPDAAIEDFVVPGSNSGGDTSSVRVFQAAVRSHMFSGASLDTLSSLGGHTAVLTLTAADSGVAVTDESRTTNKFGTLSVASSSGSITASVLRIVPSHSNPFFTFLFVDQSLHRVSPMARRTVASMKSFGVAGSQPLWQRVPCSAMKLLRSNYRKHSQPLESECHLTSVLLHHFKADEQSFRYFVVDFALEKQDDIVLRRMSTCMPAGSPTNIGPPAAPPHKINDHVNALQSSIDAAMMHLETEVSMFLSSYPLMPGYEEFTVAKVQQLVETAAELALGITDAEEEHGDMDDCDVATTSKSGQEEQWSEEEHEQLIVAFHSIVTGGLATKLVPHWADVHYNEDFAFYHACGVLRRRAGRLEDLRVGFSDLLPDHCAQLVQLVGLIDDQSLSVFSYMRVMESIIACAVERVAQVSSDNVEVTADICIPLIVYLLVLSGPRCLPSRIKYLLELGTPALEMSALGYALTTFEAAAVQLLEEYRLHVVDS